MDHSSNTAALTTINNERQIVADAQRLPSRKKKRTPMHVLRVALYMLRRKSGKSKASVHVDMASKGLWKKLLGAIRPLHSQDNNSPTKFDIEAQAQAPATMIEQFEEVYSPKDSASPCTTCSSVDGMSQYASALNLQELDATTKEDDDNEDMHHYDEDGGDEMIDSKAEEFINKFYEQMRLQHREYMSRQNSYNQRSQSQVMTRG